MTFIEVLPWQAKCKYTDTTDCLTAVLQLTTTNRQAEDFFSPLIIPCVQGDMLDICWNLFKYKFNGSLVTFVCSDILCELIYF